MKKIRDLAYKIVENQGWPRKVIIGSYWLEDLKNKKLKSYWIGDFGINAEVEVVQGKTLKIY